MRLVRYEMLADAACAAVVSVLYGTAACFMLFLVSASAAALVDTPAAPTDLIERCMAHGHVSFGTVQVQCEVVE